MWASQLALVVKKKNPPANVKDVVQSLGQGMEEGMETHSSILTCRSPWTEGPVRLQSIGL